MGKKHLKKKSRIPPDEEVVGEYFDRKPKQEDVRDQGALTENKREVNCCDRMREGAVERGGRTSSRHQILLDLAGHVKQFKVPSRYDNSVNGDMTMKRRLWKCQMAKRERAALCIF